MGLLEVLNMGAIFAVLHVGFEVFRKWKINRKIQKFPKINIQKIQKILFLNLFFLVKKGF